MRWGIEEGQCCGKALSCALEEQEAHGGGRSVCDQEHQMSVGALEMELRCSCFGASNLMPAASHKHHTQPKKVTRSGPFCSLA